VPGVFAGRNAPATLTPASAVTRDRKAVKKTVSGLLKIRHPHGEATKEEIAELLEFAMEGRRRVKEQLKKMGAFEYYNTSFCYTDAETARSGSWGYRSRVGAI
jgi:predicted ATP-dependent Lon-type protease